MMCLFRIAEAARYWASNWRLSWPKLRLADGRSCTRAWRLWPSAAPGTRCRCTRRARRWRSSAISWPAPRCPQRRTPSGRPSAGARERQLDLKFFHFRFSQRCKCNSIGKKIRNKNHSADLIIHYRKSWMHPCVFLKIDTTSQKD